MQVAIRPENVRLAVAGAGASGEAGAISAKVVEVTFLGNLTDCHVMLERSEERRVGKECRL